MLALLLKGSAQAKIDDFCLLLSITDEQNVFWLYVSMYDVFLMNIREA
jgi:hypothetical protein